MFVYTVRHKNDYSRHITNDILRCFVSEDNFVYVMSSNGLKKNCGQIKENYLS